MLTAALLVLTLAQEPPPRAPAPPGAVTGVVRGEDQGSRVLLPHAVVEWRGGNQRRTVADGMAIYRLEGLLPGRGEIRVTRVGFEPLVLEVHVPPGGSVSLDLELRSAPLPLEPVTVLVDPARPPVAGDPGDPRGAPPGAARVGMGAADAVSGLAEAGLARAAGRVSGSPGDPEEPGDMLFMRGSATEQKLVLLDGVPVAAPFHVAGLIQGFDPETLGGPSCTWVEPRPASTEGWPTSWISGPGCPAGMPGGAPEPWISSVPGPRWRVRWGGGAAS
jgi:hypothetical protein